MRENHHAVDPSEKGRDNAPRRRPFDYKRLLDHHYYAAAASRIHTLFKEDGWDVRLVEKIEWHCIWRIRIRTAVPIPKEKQRSVKIRINRLLMTHGVKGGSNIDLVFSSNRINISFIWANGVPGAVGAMGNPIRIDYPA